MNDNEIIARWYADLYDKEETETDDIDFMLSIIGGEARNILEVCCGSGRILVPLAKAGHTVTGFDIDCNMLNHIPAKAAGLDRIDYYMADAIVNHWGNDFDTVVLAGNILINIQTDMDYMEAQKLFIKKSYESLKPCGHIYMDFNCFSHPEEIFGDSGENTVFEGFDSAGNYGKYTISDSRYEQETRMASFKRRTELMTEDGRRILKESMDSKYIPTLAQVHEWLDDTGFKVLCEYGDYYGNPISGTTHKVIIWAVKNGGQ